MRSRTIVLVHNQYQQAGGEDAAFRLESSLLEGYGHSVVRYVLDNHAIAAMRRVTLAKNTLWNGAVRHELHALFAREKPAVAHFHNTFPLVSPSAYYAARDAGVPVVQTLHNYRLLCPSACLFREGQVCEDCLGKAVPWPAVVHGCYRDDRFATAVTAGMLTLHRQLRTWTELVDVYIALSEFARRTFVAGGVPEDRIIVKPNFMLTDPGVGEHRGNFLLYVGRLSAEKGLDQLVDAWSRVTDRRGFTLKIVGAGPLRRDRISDVSGVEWLGWRARDDTLALMREAACLVVPSVCYENFPMVIAEAFATGLPAIVSRHGAMGELVSDAETGLHVDLTVAHDLEAKLAWACGHPIELRRMGEKARREFELKYTASRNHDALMEAYRLAASRLANR